MVIILLLLCHIATAATIQGTVYDLDLDKIDKAVIKIDTKPTQSSVTENGQYSFYVPPGDYQVTAFLLDGDLILASASHNIEVDSDGDFKLDLILLPDLREDLQLIEESNQIMVSDQFMEEKGNLLVISIAILFFLLASIIYFLKLKRTGALLDDESLVINLLKKNSGRMNQRDLQRDTPYSKAKVSLLLTDLEHKGKIRKIQKGRGNVITLK